VRAGLVQVVEALTLRAKREGQAQLVPVRLLEDLAEALADLAFVASHGGGAEQMWARDGRPASRCSAPEAREGSPS